ncbi:MAG: hypothetical protein IJ460_08280 [Clostridia bacterium]|nr:hypothetical protein [Clostridia bacterium]
MDTVRKENALKTLLDVPYIFDTSKVQDNPVNAYGDYPILHIIKNDRLEESVKMLKYAADWYEHPHPWGRDSRGEADFAAIRLVMALYEEECYTKIPQDVKASLKKFFLNRDYSSIYGSENHSLMFRAARCLAAQFYKDEYFANFSKTAAELYDLDRQYINDFIDFRAGRGWGEFDSMGYGAEIMLILNTLYSYTDDIKLKQKCRMMMDIILLDMIADSWDCLYGGAHGRVYPDATLHRAKGGLPVLYSYYFGGKFYNPDSRPAIITYLSDYEPSPIVYKIALGKKMPYENRERKHLHCCSAWVGDILWDVLDEADGSICKFTYVCDDYVLGSVTRQEDYPSHSDDRWYARHQQHEWELTLPGGDDHKIFSHHLGIDDYHHINNRWTGDNRCCCGSYYTNKNTAIAMYNIEKDISIEDSSQSQVPVNVTHTINAFVPLGIFDEKVLEEKYLFFRYNNLYISLYFDNGYRVNKEDEFTDRELLSEGRQNAVVCRVEYCKDFESIEAFSAHIKSLPVVFDRANKTVSFDGIVLRTDGNSENGTENIYPYAKTYDCPFMQSDWDSKKIDVFFEDTKTTYDFVNNTVID